MKRLFLFLGFLINPIVYPNALKKVPNTPVSVSIKQVLEVIQSEKVKQFALKSSSTSAMRLVQKLQQTAKNIIDQGQISVNDIQFLERAVVQMKMIVALKSTAVQKKAHIELQELCVDADQALDSLVIGGVNEDVAYIKELLLSLLHAYEHGTVDYKIPLRILAIIEELFQRYDGIFVSAYTTVVLVQVALITFLLHVS